MIFGEYPCCNGHLAISLADGKLPQWQREECPHCGATVWHYHSRIAPFTLDEEAFHEEYEIEGRQVKKKLPLK
jgi:hypothetical protein